MNGCWDKDIKLEKYLSKETGLNSENLKKYKMISYISQIIYMRKVLIWGTGKLSVFGEKFLEYLKINDYNYVDSSEEKQRQTFKGRKVLSPSAITKEHYLIVSTAAFPDIAADLYKRGFHDLEDYIYVCDLDYYVHWICSTGLFQFAVIWFKLGDYKRGKRAFLYATKLQNWWISSFFQSGFT